MTPTLDTVLIPAEARADIQGLVTTGFGHLPHSGYLFVAFEDREQAQHWLAQQLPNITTAAPWRPHPGAPKHKPRATLNLAFTAAGLRRFGLSNAVLRSFPPEFLEGMASTDRARILGDEGPDAAAQWHLGGPRTPEIHSLLILNAASETDLESALALHRRHLAEVDATVVAKESGFRADHHKEPFGFRDGIAQPRIRGIHRDGFCAGEFILGYPNEYGFLPPSPLVAVSEDPGHILPASDNPHFGGTRDLGRHGTYLVYRKLEQHVAAFWTFLAHESARRRGGRADPSEMIRLGAKLMGRWPSGAPLTLAPQTDNPDLDRTDAFLYAAADPSGFGCPFGAHIRRMNPRDQLLPAGPAESLHMSARHQILRRGKPYGTPLFDLTLLDRPDHTSALQPILDLKEDGQPRGIHFLAMNASLRSQFEFLQQAWANNPNFNGLSKNPDPIIGARIHRAGPGSMLVPRPDLDLRTSPLPRFVTVRGGAYFFMPGLRALAFLAARPGVSRRD